MFKRHLRRAATTLSSVILVSLHSSAHAVPVHFNFSASLEPSAYSHEILGQSSSNTFSGYVAYDTELLQSGPGPYGDGDGEFYSTQPDSAVALLYVDQWHRSVNIDRIFVDYADAQDNGAFIGFYANNGTYGQATASDLPGVYFNFYNWPWLTPFLSGEPGQLPLGIETADVDKGAGFIIKASDLANGSPIDLHVNALSITEVPLPGAAWLMLSGVASVIGAGRRRKASR